MTGCTKATLKERKSGKSGPWAHENLLNEKKTRDWWAHVWLNTLII